MLRKAFLSSASKVGFFCRGAVVRELLRRPGGLLTPVVAQGNGSVPTVGVTFLAISPE